MHAENKEKEKKETIDLIAALKEARDKVGR